MGKFTLHTQGMPITTVCHQYRLFSFKNQRSDPRKINIVGENCVCVCVRVCVPVFVCARQSEGVRESEGGWKREIWRKRYGE